MLKHYRKMASPVLLATTLLVGRYASKQRMNIQRIQELEETRAALARVLEKVRFVINLF